MNKYDFGLEGADGAEVRRVTTRHNRKALKVRTALKAGGMTFQHNRQFLTPSSARG